MKKIFNGLRIFFSPLKRAGNIKTKISRFGLGFIFFQILNKIGIFLINPVLIYYFEFKIAILFMIIVSILIRYSLILIYDNQKIDWFLIEEFKFLLSKGKFSLKKDQNTTVKIMIVFYKFGNFVLISFLVFYDPFLLVIYIRDGFYKWNGIPTIKIYLLFMMSVISCALISAGWITPILAIIF